MFIKAIKNNLECIKPFNSASKTPYSDTLKSDLFPLVFINDEGYVLTTKAVATRILVADKIRDRYDAIRKELIENKIPPKKIYKKYKVKDDDVVILKNVFLNSLSGWKGIQIYMHEYLDLALLKFEEPKDIYCKEYPILAKDNPSQGEYLCRLGFPYPEFNAFRYDHSCRDIIVNEMINNNIQIFPVEGMVTRNLLDSKNNLSMFELSNNTYIGEGPIINKKGELVGFQVGAAFKDNEIDINTKIKRNNKEIEVKQYNFIPYSLCINIKTIKEFLDKHKVKYEEK